MVQYESLILGMKVAILMNMKKIKIFDDSELIIKKVSNIYNTKDPKLQPYKEMVESLLIYFNVDAMASAASLDPISIEYEETILTIKIISNHSHEFVVKNFIKDHYFLLFLPMHVNGIKIFSIILNMVLFLLYLIIMLELD